MNSELHTTLDDNLDFANKRLTTIRRDMVNLRDKIVGSFDGAESGNETIPATHMSGKAKELLVCIGEIEADLRAIMETVGVAGEGAQVQRKSATR